MGFLDDIRVACASAPSFEEACARAVKALRTLPGYDWVGIYLLEGRELVLGAWDGPEATEHVDRTFVLDLLAELVQRAVHNALGHGFFSAVHDARDHPRDQLAVKAGVRDSLSFF